MGKLPHRSEWEKLREAITQIESHLASTDSQTPTRLMCELLIAGEDRRFYYHPGVDPIALLRAAWKTVFCGSRQGASTIAMQLVRTITGRYEKTWQRKAREILLAIRLTHYVERKKLPAIYLCVAYYGWKMHNFGQACLRLKIEPESLNDLESAKLVARLKYPEPFVHDGNRVRQIQCRAQHLLALTDLITETRWINLAGQNVTIQNCNTVSKVQ